MVSPEEGEPEPSCKRVCVSNDSGYTSQSSTSNYAPSSSNPAEEVAFVPSNQGINARVGRPGTVVDFAPSLLEAISHREEHPYVPQNAVLRNEPQVPSNSQGLDEEYAVPPSPQSPYRVGGWFPDSPVHNRVQFDHLDELEVGLLDVISAEGNSRQDGTEEQGLVTRTILDISDANFNVVHYNYLFDLSHPHFLRNYHFLRRGTAYPLSRISAIISEYAYRTLEYTNDDGMPVDQRVALEWIRDFLKALKFLQSENIVHGRIAPWRVFFDEGMLKLHLVSYQLIPMDTSDNELSLEHVMSWGQESMNTKTYSRFRNLVYTADEVRTGGIPTKESDVYSAASVAYRILEGRDPSLDKEGLHSILVSAETNQLLTRSWAREKRPTVEALSSAIDSEIHRVALAV